MLTPVQTKQIKSFQDQRDEIMRELLNNRRQADISRAILRNVTDAITIANKNLEKINAECDFKTKYVYQILGDLAARIKDHSTK